MIAEEEAKRNVLIDRSLRRLQSLKSDSSTRKKKSNIHSYLQLYKKLRGRGRERKKHVSMTGTLNFWSECFCLLHHIFSLSLVSQNQRSVKKSLHSLPLSRWFFSHRWRGSFKEKLIRETNKRFVSRHCCVTKPTAIEEYSIITWTSGEHTMATNSKSSSSRSCERKRKTKSFVLTHVYRCLCVSLSSSVETPLSNDESVGSVRLINLSAFSRPTWVLFWCYRFAISSDG